MRIFSIPIRKLLCAVLFTPLVAATFAQGTPGIQNDSLARQFKHRRYGFIENKGQVIDQAGRVNNAVKYLLPFGNGLNVQLKQNSFSYDTYILQDTAKTRINRSKGPVADQREKHSMAFHRVDVSFEGANPSPVIIAENPFPDRMNYYTTSSVGGISVSHFYKITYLDIYPGIDLVFESGSALRNKNMEYYFIVHPRADAKQIKLHYTGASGTQLKNGKIAITVKQGIMEEQIPASYLSSKKKIDVSQLHKETPVLVKYKPLGSDTYGFDIPPYNKEQTLIIDPTPDLLWGTYFGDMDNDFSHCIAKDANDNFFIGGGTLRPINLATAGAHQTVLDGYSDAFFAKFTTNGALLWCSYYGGSDAEQIEAIGVDRNNNVLITGHTWSPNAIATPGAHQAAKAGPYWPPDAFVAKFTNDGVRLWGTYFGGESVEQTHGIAADKNNNIIIAGWTHSLTGVSTPGAHQVNYAGGPPGLEEGDAFLTKFNSNGVVQWSTYYGGNDFDRFYSLALDKNDNILVGGITISASNISTTGSHQPNFGGDRDGLIVKFNNDGVRQWATYYGGSNLDYVLGITTDQENNVLITGPVISPNNISTPGSHQPASGSAGDYDTYVAKLTPGGARLWGTYYGGSGQEFTYGIATDMQNNVFIVGSGFSPNNITTPGSYQPIGSGHGWWIPFLVKFTSTGARQWGTYYGYDGPYGNGDGRAVVTDAAGNPVITGWTANTKGISTCNAHQPNWALHADAFISKFTETGSPTLPAVQIISSQNTAVCVGTPVTFTANPLNGGTNPTYQWKLNGNNVGTNSATYTSATLAQGDVISCVMTSNSTCVTVPQATSNNITVSIITPVTPALSITGPNGTICTGATVSFTAIPVNGGATPAYQWKLNGVNIGTNSPAYTTNSLADGDVVSCVLTNAETCVTTATANSNNITVDVSSSVTPTVNIQVTGNAVCAGNPVSFTAQAANAGSNPSYQWKVNGNPVGTNSATFISGNLANNDIVQCTITTNNAGCVTAPQVSSNEITAVIYPVPVITLSATDTVLLKGNSTTLHATITGNISQFEVSPSTGLTITGTNTFLASPENTITYHFAAISADGCPAAANIRITVLIKIQVPNIFSPNGDGINDTWNIIGLNNYAQCTVDIYNRYGQRVFRSNGYNTPWNGTLNNNPLPVGTYYYVIDPRHGQPVLNGHVTIIR